MKTKILAVIAGMILVTGLAGCGRQPASESGNTTTPAASDSAAAVNEETITEAEAKKIALEHAGVEEADATFIKTQLDIDDGRQIYEVEFYSQNIEYDYDINAVTGDVVGYDQDVEGYEIQSKSQIDQAAGNDIGEEEAKRIALERVSGAAENDIRIHKDYDDGVMVYEGTIIFNEQEYEFEINAADGSVRDWSQESVYDD